MSGTQFLYFKAWDLIVAIIFNSTAIFPIAVMAKNGDMSTLTNLICMIITSLICDLSPRSDILIVLLGVTMANLLIRVAIISKCHDSLVRYLQIQSCTFLIPLLIKGDDAHFIVRELTHLNLGLHLLNDI